MGIGTRTNPSEKLNSQENAQLYGRGATSAPAFPQLSKRHLGQDMFYSISQKRQKKKAAIGAAFLQGLRCVAGLGGDDGFLRNAGFLALLEEGHHGAQLSADFLNRLIFSRFTHSEEVLPSGAVLRQPGAREFAALDLAEDLLHLLACFFGDDPGPARVVAVFGRVGDGVAHITEAAFIDKVDDQLEL